MNDVIDNNQLSFTIDGQIYNEETILKTLYWLSGTFQIDIRMHDNSLFNIVIRPTTSAIVDWESVTTKINKDLIDNQLRYIIKIETSNIRDLIVAKAFSHYDILKESGDSISDPVGFDPKTI